MIEWDDLPMVEEFLLCVPLKEGTIVIAIFGLIYGFYGLIMFLSVPLNYTEWKSLYEKKMDLLSYITLLFAIIAKFTFTSFVLLIGILREYELLFRIYLWSVVSHLVLDWMITLAICVYCFFVNHTCFQNPGGGIAFSVSVLTVLYSAFWIYIIIVVNSCRSELRYQ